MDSCSRIDSLDNADTFYSPFLSLLKYATCFRNCRHSHDGRAGAIQKFRWIEILLQSIINALFWASSDQRYLLCLALTYTHMHTLVCLYCLTRPGGLLAGHAAQLGRMQKKSEKTLFTRITLGALRSQLHLRIFHTYSHTVVQVFQYFFFRLLLLLVLGSWWWWWFHFNIKRKRQRCGPRNLVDSVFIFMGSVLGMCC